MDRLTLLSSVLLYSIIPWLAADTVSAGEVASKETYVTQWSDPIDLFIAGKEEIEGVENAAQKYAQYREQNVVVTNNGTVVVICQARNDSPWSDRSGQDLVAKISTDSGESWSKAHLVVSHDLKSICPNAAVYDRDTNRIHVLYNLFTWDYTSVPDDVKGELGDLHCRQFIISSDDVGRTWSKPRDISDLMDTHGAVMVVGSGEGIQLKHGPYRGRLIVAGGDFFQGKKVLCYYSDDHGVTWQRSNTVPWEGEIAWASESKVAELRDGTLVLNSRTFVKDGGKQRLRTRSFSRDGGITWTRLENDDALKTVSCNGSLIAVDHGKGRNNTVLLCSVPAGPKRTHGMVYASFDAGLTWPVSKVVVRGEFAYSSLVRLPDGTIGLFYETRNHRDIKLIKIDLDHLLDRPEDEPMFSTVFEKKKEGYHEYRIPALVTSKKGTLLAIAEGRQSLSDHAENDIVLKRSEDRGSTWDPLIVVHEDGANVLVNPCAVVLDSGRILVMFQRFPAGYHARAMRKEIKRLTAGLEGATVSLTLITFSDDDGLTWSDPIDVTAGTKRMAPIISTATGPGVGIVLCRGKYRGRIIMPTNEGWWEGDRRFFNVYACYSDDGGQSWQCGDPAPNGSPGYGNEVQMAELADGSILLNCRSDRGNKCRKSAVSPDGGQTWSPLRDEEQLPESQCMGTLLRNSFPDEGRNRLVFANPAIQKGRKHGTVRLSYDEGKSWPIARTIYEGGFAYSCLTRLQDGSLGLLFEKDGYKKIEFVRFSLEWLTAPLK